MHRVVLLVLLSLAGSPLLLHAQDLACGQGIYRPFNLFRQIKLGTAYLVNPELPERAQVVNVYGFREAVNEKGMDWAIREVQQNRMSLFVARTGDEDSLVLIQPSGVCLPSEQIPTDSQESTVRSLLETIEQTGATAYIGSTTPNTWTFGEHTSEFVTWDPTETVARVLPEP